MWIEIAISSIRNRCCYVTPLAGVWIEIFREVGVAAFGIASLPLRECGLKLHCKVNQGWKGKVTPLAGVWIEINAFCAACFSRMVTPLAGVWIEIN